MARTRSWLVNETIVLTAIVVGVGAIVSGLGSGSALAAPTICDAIAGNLVQNCSFEIQPPFTNWTTIPAAIGSDFDVTSNASSVNSGTYAAEFGAVGVLDDTITQSLATTFGSQYTVKFWLANNGGNVPDNDFKALWNAIPLLNFVNDVSFAYTEYTFSEIGTGSDLLTFAGRNHPSFYYLDDVSGHPCRGGSRARHSPPPGFWPRGAGRVAAA